MRMVGLTGGIGSGKSTVSNLFKSHGVPVIDADVIARDVLKKGRGGWKKAVNALGGDILLLDGEIDRSKLGRIVFNDHEKRQLLKRLMVPYISSVILMEVLKLWVKGWKIIILDVPLLFEAKMDKWTSPIVVVWVDPTSQLQRLIARDRATGDDAKSRINAQMSLDMKRTKVDFVIDNTRSLVELNEEFQKVTKPLTWTEFALSRRSILAGGIICRKMFG